MRRTTALVLACVLAACRGAPAKVPSEHAAAPSPVPSAPQVESGAATVKLENPGAEPRSPLRYVYAGKSRTVDVTLSTESGDVPQQPPVHVAFTATPRLQKAPAPATMELELTAFEPAFPSSASAETLEQANALVGMKGHYDVTSFGDVGDATFDADRQNAAAQDLAGALSQLFELLTVPVPREAVGVGAKWIKSDAKHSDEANVSMTTTIALLARDARTATLSVEHTANGSMLVSDARVPKGTIVRRTATGSFTVVVRFDGVAEKIDGHTTTRVTEAIPGQPEKSIVVKLNELASSRDSSARR